MGGNEHPRGVMGTTGKGTRNRGGVNTTRRLILVHFYPPRKCEECFTRRCGAHTPLRSFPSIPQQPWGLVRRQGRCPIHTPPLSHLFNTPNNERGGVKPTRRPRFSSFPPQQRGELLPGAAYVSYAAPLRFSLPNKGVFFVFCCHGILGGGGGSVRRVRYPLTLFTPLIRGDYYFFCHGVLGWGGSVRVGMLPSLTLFTPLMKGGLLFAAAFSTQCSV